MFTIERNTPAFYQSVNNYRSILEILPRWMVFSDGLLRGADMTDVGDVITCLVEAIVNRDWDKISTDTSVSQRNLDKTLYVQNVRSRVCTALFDQSTSSRGVPQLLADPIMLPHHREQMDNTLLRTVELAIILFHTLRNRLGIVRLKNGSYEGLDDDTVYSMLAQNAHLIRLGKITVKPRQQTQGDNLIFKAETGTWIYSRQLVLRWGYSNHFAELLNALWVNYAGKVAHFGKEYIKTLPSLSREDELELRGSMWLFHARYLNALFFNQEFSTAANYMAANAASFSDDLTPPTVITAATGAVMVPYEITKQLVGLLAAIDLIGRRLAKMDSDTPNRHSDLQAFLKMLRKENKS
jgi:hypothetical protein